MHIKTPPALTSAYVAARSKPSVRLGYVVVLSAVVFYTLLIAGTGLAMYRHTTDNRFTHFVERLFPYPLATVDQRVIPLSRFRLEVAARDHYAAAHNLGTTHQTTEQFVLDRLVTTALYEMVLQNNHITVQNSDVQNKLNEIYKQIGGQDKLAKFLRDNYGPDVSIDQFKVWIQESLEEAAVQNQLLEKATVRHILIALPDNPTDAQVADALKRAQDIRSKITDANQFGAVAKQYSEDITSRDKDGQLGSTLRGDDAPVFSKDFEDAIFTLPIGKVSDPIRSKYGWHIVIVDQRTGTINLSAKAYSEQLQKQAHIRTFLKI